MRETTQKALIKAADGDVFDFYQTQEWRELSKYVRQIDRNECQMCKAKGRYRRGSIVHHVKELRDRPDLALSIIDTDTGERQLITVCKQCHESQHPQALRRNNDKVGGEYSERWD